ncbi:MAG: GNAT family N-acetyltransferase [Saprospiraceae bacterium]|nr:GNAT family N-acetyltransferase [Saprospiraceae bacterium]
MSNFKSFETERLWLKPIGIEDADFILKLVNTPKWIEFIGDRNVKKLEDAVLYIQEKMLPHQEKRGFGNFTVIRKSDLSKMGTCGLYQREEVDGVDIGFAFLPEFESQGFAFEAAQKIKTAAFEVFGLKELLAYTIPENQSSRKLLEKLGMVLAGTTQLPNDPVELLQYRLSL